MSWLTVRDHGQTWDEIEFVVAVRHAPSVMAQLLRGEIVQWGAGELPGHGMCLDLVRWLPLAAFSEDTLADDIRVLHAFHAVLAAASLFFLGRLVLRITRCPRIATLATLALGLSPQFIAHSQNNPKDLGALFVFVWSLEALVEFFERRRAVDGVMAALTLGLAASTRVTSALVIFVALPWALMTSRLRSRAHFLRLAAVLLGSCLATVLLWPWLWRNPVGNAIWAARHVSHFWFDAPVQYLGRLYTGRTTPWHYSIVNVAAFTPLPFVVLAALGVWAGARRDYARGVVALALTWFVVLWLVDLGASSHYDGVRHLLSILPGIAVLVAVGADWALVHGARLPRVLVGGAMAWVLAWDIHFHPYCGAYVNGPAKLLAGSAVEKYFPVEYWGASYAEGARWVAEHVEPGARLYVPVGHHVATAQMSRLVEEHLPDELSGAYYVMYITRVDSYSRALRRLDSEYCPVFSIARDGIPLLKVISHQSRSTRDCGRECRCPD